MNPTTICRNCGQQHQRHSTDGACPVSGCYPPAFQEQWFDPNSFVVAPAPQSPKRLGKFRVHRELLENWRQMIAVMCDLVVVRCEMNHATDTMDYIAFSDHFDEVQCGLEAPEYVAEITNANGILAGVAWKRCQMLPARLIQAITTEVLGNVPAAK